MASIRDTRHPAGRKARFRAVTIALASLLSLPGCATIDHFGTRSARFNVAAVDGRSQAILANVMRATYGKPLQFSDLTTVTGQATMGGELGLSVPFAVDPNTTARTFTGSPKLTASGTSTFNVANLNSREFYNGLQTPISVQNIANFIASGYDRQLLLFLTISDIEILEPDKRIVFHSDPSDPKNFRLFYQAVAFLREAGLSTRSAKPSVVGPSFPASALSDPKVLATMLGSPAGDLSLKPDPDKEGNFRFYKKAGLEFCFDPILIDKTLVQTARADVLFNTPTLRSMARVQTTPIQGALVVDGGKPFPAASFEIEPFYFCDAPKGAEKTQKTEIRITTRSVEGIFQFLGDIVRTQIGLTKDAKSDLLSITRSDGSGAMVPFRVIPGVPSNAVLTILAEGHSYSIVGDPSGAEDQTTRVFQLLTDLLAIQSSAKDLPTPNVVSILTP